jgi:hypothetical protein
MKFAGFAEGRLALTFMLSVLSAYARAVPGLSARLIADLRHYSIPVCDDDVNICLCSRALLQTAFVKI